MTKNPFASIADIHGHNHKSHSTIIKGVNSRLLVSVEAIKSAVDMAVAAGCEILAICGDMTHVRGHLRPSVLNCIHSALEYAGKRICVVIISGNHDMENFKGGATSIDTFESINGVYVMGAPSVLRVRDYVIVGIPYQHSSEDFKGHYKRLVADERPDVVLMHQYIDDFTPAVMPETGITVDWLRQYKPEGPIFSGHYHIPCAKENVVSVGSPTQDSFGDEGARGLWIFDGDKEINFHEIEGTPQFVTITRKPKDLAAAVAGNYIRIIAKTVPTAEKLREQCMAAGALSVVVKLEKAFKTAHEKTITLAEPAKMLGQYIDIMGGQFQARRTDIINLYERLCL